MKAAPTLEVSKECRYSPAVRHRVCGSESDKVVRGLSMMAIGELLMATHLVPTWVAFDLIVCGLTYIVAVDRRTRRRAAEFGESLRPDLGAHYGVDLSAAMQIGLTPGQETSDYNNDRSWDIGFVLVNDRFRYYGDQCAFSLADSQIAGAKVNFDASRLLIEFVEPGFEGSRWVSLEARGISYTARYMALHRLRAQLLLLPKGEPSVARELPTTEPRHESLIRSRA
ncbi:MAG TPA: hypothetical protein VHE55_00765 [Fimbriimonadaceae bacterium]|nr:hypothetical protein [Fimbriimonadaceae bacterium]